MPFTLGRWTMRPRTCLPHKISACIYEPRGFACGLPLVRYAYKSGIYKDNFRGLIGDEAHCVKGIGSRYKALIVTILGWLAARGECAHARLIKKRSARRVCAHTIDWRECHSKTPPPMRPFSIVAATGQFALIGNGARRYVREKGLALAWAERGSSYVRIYV